MIGGWLSVWPPLPPGLYVRRPVPRLPFPLEASTCRLFASAPHALHAGVRRLGLGSGDEVLSPAYHHGAEIEALCQAGIACRWYDANQSLEPQDDELDALMNDRVRALYLIHYLGFPQHAVRWRRWCDDRGLLLIEDATQAWLSVRDGDPVGSVGDIGVFCLRNSFGFPYGAALVSRVPPPARAPAARFGVGPLLSRHGAWLAQRFGVAAPLASAIGDSRWGLERALERRDGAPSASVERLLSRACDPEAGAVRRAHHAVLSEALGDLAPPPFGEAPAGAVPFAFPVRTDDKPALAARLLRAHIRAADAWPVAHPSLPAGRFPRAAERRASTLLLPIHQELRSADLERITMAVRPALACRRELRTEPIEDIDALRDQWTELAARAGNVFSSWEWASTWWRHYASEQALMLYACRDAAGRLVAILPLCRGSIARMRTIRFIGHGVSDQLGPVCGCADRPAVARALRRLLRDSPCGWDAFIADRVPADHGWSALLPGHRVRREPSPTLNLRGRTWAGFLAARSPNLRQQVRRRERRLQRERGLRFRLATDPDRLGDDMTILFALHAARWGAESTSFVGTRGDFHREFADRALQRGWLRLWFAELDGSPVAAWYGLRFAGAEYFCQSGRDPREDAWSVGFVLLSHTIREAFQDGQHTYRLLRGGEAYKKRFADGDAPVDTLLAAHGVTGAAAVTAVRTAARSRHGRRLLGRLGA